MLHKIIKDVYLVDAAIQTVTTSTTSSQTYTIAGNCSLFVLVYNSFPENSNT